MTLKDYRKKRSTSSPEPHGEKRRRTNKTAPLTYVIQKHAASHLHWDLRLEAGGVLMSWAVPKEPTMDSSVKRLAIHVEDHPLEYGSFEGTIPKGHYGAGTVEIWDKGTYTVDGDSREDQERSIKKQMAKGELRFTLHGARLHGEYLLVRLHRDQPDKEWLLMKAKENDKKRFKTDAVPRSIQGVKAAMPHDVKPMLAHLVNEAFDSPDWLFEVKWDGYRAIAEVNGKSTRIYSRNLLSFSDKFPTIMTSLRKLKVRAVLDGEIVILDKQGRSQFQMLQNYLNSGEAEGSLQYCIFDILYCDGRDLRKLPLTARKELLQSLLKSVSDPLLHYSDHVETQGKKFFNLVKKQDLEGIIAKEMASEYVSRRSQSWLKIKSHQRQEVVIAGYTEPRGSRKNLGALIIGVHKAGKFLYAGHVGGGFTQSSLKEMHRLLQPLRTEKCPFKTVPHTNMPVTWVKPSLVCEVAFQEWTKEGIMRQPIFKGLRRDKPARNVKKELPIPNKVKSVTRQSNNSTILTPGQYKHSDIETNRSKVYWPKSKLTKGDLLDYYEAIAPIILPYLKDRPLVMNRFPEGIASESFYQKEAPKQLPEWMPTITVPHSEKMIRYLTINSVESLLYAVNLGSIELHTFMSRAQSLNEPDFIALDLDPENLTFDHVVEVAQVTHRLLDELQIAHVCKTSGKRGLHICIPLGAKYQYDQAAEFAKLLATLIHQKIPDQTSLIRNPKKRQKLVYIDFLQNSRTKTVVAPYSVRPVEPATVSTPIDWKELNGKLDPTDFTIKTLLKRVARKGDLFRVAIGRGVNVAKCLARLEALQQNDL